HGGSSSGSLRLVCRFSLLALNHFARPVRRHLEDLARERERRVVELGDRRAGVAAHAQPAADANREWYRHGKIRLPHQLAVDVKLRATRRAFALRDFWRPRRFELETQFNLALRDFLLRLDVELLGADVVMDVLQFLVLDEEGVAANIAAVADDHAFGAALRDFDLGGETEGAVERLDGDIFRHALRVRIIDVGLALFGEL